MNCKRIRKHFTTFFRKNCANNFGKMNKKQAAKSSKSILRNFQVEKISMR